MGFIQTYETDLNQSFIRFKKERKVFTEISNHKGVIRALNYLLTRDEEKKPYLLVWNNDSYYYYWHNGNGGTLNCSNIFNREKNTFPVLQRFYYKDNTLDKIIKGRTGRD